MQIVTLVVNKNWECEPVLNALTASEIKCKQLPFPATLNSPKDKTNRMNAPRSVFYLQKDGNVTMKVNVWCIQDLMNPKRSSSSSEEKYNVLPQVIASDNPNLVIALGTAAYPGSSSLNGSIVVGGQFFVHNGHPDNPDSNLNRPEFDTLLKQNVDERLFAIFTPEFRKAVSSKMLPVPNNPASALDCVADPKFVSLGTVNVTDYREYATADPITLQKFNDLKTGFAPMSVETTNGVIKMSTDKPIMFFSAIANRLGHFDREVTASQNYACAFNAGILLGDYLVGLNELIHNSRI